MIAPGTLVQYVRNEHPNLRPHGVYTVRTSWRKNTPCGSVVTGEFDHSCDAPAISLEEALPSGRGIGFCMCSFRIIAPPITEADRLEASAPHGDAPAKPKRVRA